MTKLISTYARSMGLQIDPKGPRVMESFYPHPFPQYITLQTGTSAQAAKNYDHWDIVIALLKPILDANRIAVLHLGGKDDPTVPGTHDLRGKTSIHQANYLVGKTLLHLGGDSWLAHCAGWHYKPLVALYGTTDPGPHGPYWSDPAKTSLIVSHRWGGRPTYVLQEPVKTINLIDPHHVANEVLRLLGIQHVFPHQTRFVGLLAKHTVLDLVPNSVPAPTFMPDLIMNVRMDVQHNEQVLQQVLSTGRRVSLLVSQPISDLNLLAHYRAQIVSYTHELGVPGAALPSAEYVGSLRGILPRHAFFTREQDLAKVAQLRFTYLDHAQIEQVKDLTKEDYLRETLLYLNRKDTPENRLDIERELAQDRGELSFRTTRYVLSDGKVFLSYPHMLAGQSITSLAENTGKVMDDPLWHRDLNHYAVTFTPSAPPQPTP